MLRAKRTSAPADRPRVVLVGDVGAAVRRAAADAGAEVVEPGEFGLLDEPAAVVVASLPSGPSEADAATVEALRAQSRSSFLVLLSPAATTDPELRQTLSDSGLSMYSADPDAVAACLGQSLACRASQGRYNCPHCDLAGVSEDGLWRHMPLHHIGYANLRAPCPVCERRDRAPLQVHVHNQHGPAGRGEHPQERNDPCELASFALVVCRRPSDGKFLLVQEHASCGFWLPGGRVDAGEDLVRAAARETEEEAGVAVRMTGVLSFEFTPGRGYTRLRIIFLAEPVDEEAPPKSVPDYESMGACWTSLEELRAVRLRGPEPVRWFEHVEAGGVVAPMSVLGSEHDYR